MGLYFGETELTGLYFGDIELTGLYFGEIEIWAAWAEYDGTLPAQYTANGDYLADYRVYGSAGGAGDDSGTAYGYEVDMSVRSANLFDADFVRGSYRSSDGVFQDSTNYITNTTKVVVESEEMYTINFKSSFSGNINREYAFFWNIQNQYVGAVTMNNHSFSTPASAAYCSISMGSTTSGLLPSDISEFMLNEGSTALPYQPYSNITTPIYIGSDPLGEDEYADYKAGKIYRRNPDNYFDGYFEAGAIDYNTGEEIPSASSIRTEFIELEPSNRYYIKWKTGNLYVLPVSYDENKNYVRYLGAKSQNPSFFDLGANEKYIRFYLYNTTTPPKEIMVCKNARAPYLQPQDPPVPLPALPTVDGTNIVDYVGQATAETETNNIMPSAAAETKTVGNTTVTCDGDGRYHIAKTGSGDDYVSFDVPEFTIPISVAGGGNGTVSFFNTMSDKAAVAFYNGSAKIDSWNMNTANRQTNSYGTMAGKVCNKIEINAWGSGTWTGDICIMFTNDSVLPSAFVPHIVETAKPRPSRFHAKYKKG